MSSAAPTGALQRIAPRLQIEISLARGGCPDRAVGVAAETPRLASRNRAAIRLFDHRGNEGSPQPRPSMALSRHPRPALTPLRLTLAIELLAVASNVYVVLTGAGSAPSTVAVALAAAPKSVVDRTSEACHRAPGGGFICNGRSLIRKRLRNTPASH